MTYIFNRIANSGNLFNLGVGTFDNGTEALVSWQHGISTWGAGYYFEKPVMRKQNNWLGMWGNTSDSRQSRQHGFWPGSASYGLGFCSGNDPHAAASKTDVHIYTGASGYIDLRTYHGTSESLRIYNTYTDASNSERAMFEWSNDNFIIAATGVGIGSNRNIYIGTSGTTTYIDSNVFVGTSSSKIGFFGATPTGQPASGSLSEANFIENAGGTAVNVDSTIGGYTVQQVAQALKDLGLLK